MRIQSITMPVMAQRKDYNTGYTQNKQHINFGEIKIKKLKKMPLEQKLTHLFTTMGTGDLLVVGKNLQEVQKGLLKTVTGLDELIKRLLFICHGGVSEPMAFSSGEKGIDVNYLNIGENPIYITSGGDTIKIEPTDSCTIDSGDIITNKNMVLEIEPEADFSEHIDDYEDMKVLLNPESYVTKVLNFDDVQVQWINKGNKEAIRSILKLENDDVMENKKLSFKDVGGMDETIETLKRSILYPIKFPFAYENVALNRGILLYGKPGTGKTLLAEALAGESNAKFIKICGTDLESKWVGETEEKWRNLFKDAIDNQPSIIFIDEFDAVVKERGQDSSSTYSDKVVNQILSLMSDLEKGSDNVFVIATTNKPDKIDSAIKRSGRFGKQIEVKEPNRAGKSAIFDIHVRNKQLDPKLNRNKLLDMFEARRFTGADIKHIANEAHTNSWIRSGVFEKMSNNTLTPRDMIEVMIKMEDFELAIADWDKYQTSKIARPMGFHKS